MLKDPRKYEDPTIGKTMKQIYWVDGKPTFVPPHLHEKAREEAVRFMSCTNPGKLEVLS